MKKTFKKGNIKIGILGGTFDPPHIGHVKICKIALKKFNLQNIFWVVDRQNPFKKKPKFNHKTRILLSKKILKSHKQIFVKNFSKNKSFKNTYKLLNFIKKNNKKNDLFFLMGADNLINFHKWQNWKKIPNLARLIIFARPKFSNKALKSVASKKLKKKSWSYVKFTKINISSSKLRKI